MAVKKELQPALVRDGGDEVEALSVDITTYEMNVRCDVAYGCQESDKVKKKDDFWSYLDEEVTEAASNDTGFVLQFDGNLWGGNYIIARDTRPQTGTESILSNFLSGTLI